MYSNAESNIPARGGRQEEDSEREFERLPAIVQRGPVSSVVYCVEVQWTRSLVDPSARAKVSLKLSTDEETSRIVRRVGELFYIEPIAPNMNR